MTLIMKMKAVEEQDDILAKEKEETKEKATAEKDERENRKKQSPA